MTPLRGTDLTVDFGGVRALHGVSMDIERGKLTAVVGPNGAGKTTLFNCLTGYVRPTVGTVELDGTDVSSLTPHQRARAGMSRTFQTPRVDLETDVLTAAALGCYTQFRPSLLSSLLGLPTARRRERDVERRTREALQRVGLQDLADRRVGELSLAHLRLLEVARAVVGEPRFVLLDEPVAGLAPDDHERLAQMLRNLCADGIGVMLIEHNLEFVAAVSERIVVLHQGTLIFTGGPAELRNAPEVRAAYTGKTTTATGGDSS